MTTFSKNVKIFITKSDIENSKLGFESPDPSEHSETISFSGKIWMKGRKHGFGLFFRKENSIKYQPQHEN